MSHNRVAVLTHESFELGGFPWCLIIKWGKQVIAEEMGWSNRERLVNGCRISFRDDENVLKLDSDGSSHIMKIPKATALYPLKWLNQCILSDVYFTSIKKIINPCTCICSRCCPTSSFLVRKILGIDECAAGGEMSLPGLTGALSSSWRKGISPRGNGRSREAGGWTGLLVEAGRRD